MMCFGFLYQDGDKLIRLWIHEVYRVFYDRLIDDEDKEMFFSTVKERTSNFFKQNVEKVHIVLDLGIYLQVWSHLEITVFYVMLFYNSRLIRNTV